MCSADVVNGQNVVLDLNSADDTSHSSCSCEAYISGNQNAIQLRALFALQPGYNGCGTHIDITIAPQGSTSRHACFINNVDSVVDDGDEVTITLTKESTTVDSSYCLNLKLGICNF